MHLHFLPSRSIIVEENTQDNAEVKEVCLWENNRIKSIHSSLEIEANSLSMGQVRDVINGKPVLGEQREIQEVKVLIPLKLNMEISVSLKKFGLEPTKLHSLPMMTIAEALVLPFMVQIPFISEMLY